MSSVRYQWHGEAVSAAIVERCMRVVEETTTRGEAATKVRIVQVGAVDTGNLLNTTTSRMVDDLEGEVSCPAPYALYVHDGHHLVAWGHDTGRYIPGRPFLRPVLAELAPSFRAALDQAVNG